MIAGETEILMNRYSEEYDDFFGLFKKKKTEEEKSARKTKRKKFWSGVSTTLKDLSALSIPPDSTRTMQAQVPGEQDYKISLGPQSPDTLGEEDGEEDKKEDEKPILLYVVSGVLLVGLGIWGYHQLQKANQLA